MNDHNAASNSTTELFRYTDSFEYMQRVRAGLPPVMICLAVNGGVQGKESNPHLPESADEIADSVAEAYEAGATMVHVHARDPENLSRCARSTDAWYEQNRKIRERCPQIVINNTTGGDFDMTNEQRLACLDARPEIASLNLTPDMSRFKLKARQAPLSHPRAEIDYDGCVPITYGTVAYFAAEMQRRNIRPELETYHSGGMWVIRHLIDSGLVRSPYLIQTVMGVQTSSYPTPENVINLLKELPPETVWLCSGIGPFQTPMVTLAALMGGHVRVGMEDNVYYGRGQLLDSNRQAVERIVRIAGELGRKVATPLEARTMLGISQKPTTY